MNNSGGNWRNTGTAWKYRNPVTKNRALISDGKLKVKIKSGVTYTLADDGSQGAVNAQVQFGFGTRYCMRCTGQGKDDVSGPGTTVKPFTCSTDWKTT